MGRTPAEGVPAGWSSRSASRYPDADGTTSTEGTSGMGADDAMTPTAGDGEPGTTDAAPADAAPTATAATAEGDDPTIAAGEQASAGPPTTMPSRQAAIIRAGGARAPDQRG